MRPKRELVVEVFVVVAFLFLGVVQTQAGAPGGLEARIKALEVTISDLQSKINTQQSASTTLQSDLSAAQATIAALQTALNAETTARQVTDSQLRDNLDAESKARQDGDAQLQGRMDNVQVQAANLQMSGAMGFLRANPTFIVSLVVLMVASTSLYRAVAKPRVKVYFWDQTTRRISKAIAVTPGETTFRFVFRNYGDLLRLWKPAATGLTVFVYVPEEFRITAARRFEAPEVSLRQDEIYTASPSGIFAGRKYFAVPSVYQVRPPSISIVSYKEDIICEVDIVVPGSPNTWEIDFQLASREGGLHSRKLYVTVHM